MGRHRNCHRGQEQSIDLSRSPSGPPQTAIGRTATCETVAARWPAPIIIPTRACSACERTDFVLGTQEERKHALIATAFRGGLFRSNRLRYSRLRRVLKTTTDPL